MTGTREANLALLRTFVSAWLAGEAETAMAMYDPDVVVSVAGRNPLAGVYRGIEGFRQYHENLMALTGGTFWVEDVEALLASDTFGLALVRERGSRNGKSVVSRRAVLYRIADGRITETRVYERDRYELDAFYA